MQENIQKPKLELIKNHNQFKMVIPPAVEEKIRLACASVPNLEWSGVLFFKYRGSFEDQSLLVTCKDILVMDIGSASYTEWEADAEVISYMAENDLLDCQLGIVHSHNTMASFFSGTDTATLLQEGTDRNNIVSLIVNNDGKYSAAVTRRVTTQATVHEVGTYQLFGEGEQHYEDDYETEDEYIEYFMFDIVRKEPNKLFSFIDRLKEVMTKKRTTVVASQPTAHSYGGYGMYDSYGSPYSSTPAKPPTTVAPKSTPVVPAKPMASVPSKPATTFFSESSVSKPAKLDDFDEFIEGLCLQIVTGNICAAVENIVDLDTYAKEAMYEMYKKRFGTDVSSKSSFSNWMDSTLDFLVYESVHPEIESFGVSDRGDILASEMVKRLKKLPKNIYLNAIIDHLTAYQ